MESKKQKRKQRKFTPEFKAERRPDMISGS